MDYLNKALSIDSLLVPALATLGLIQSIYDHDWKKSGETLEKAIRLDPRYAWSYIFLGNLLIYTGENPAQGIVESKKAFDLDPLSASMNWILGRNYYYDAQYDEAERYLKKALVLNPRTPLIRNWLARVFIEKKDFAQALDTIRKIPASGNITNYEYQGTILAYYYAITGNRIQAKKEMAKFLAEKSFNAHYYIAMDYVGINEYKLAFEELEKSINDNEIFLYFLKVDPVFFPLKKDPRFIAILKELNF